MCSQVYNMEDQVNNSRKQILNDQMIYNLKWQSWGLISGKPF